MAYDGTSGVGPLTVRRGVYLPHWTREDATYFVTYRLHDSLAASVRQDLAEERREMLRHVGLAGHPLGPLALRRAHELFSDRTDALLAAGAGECWLARPGIAKVAQETLLRLDGQQYDLLSWCIMPNHVHTIVHVLPGHELHRVVHAWKSCAAHRANKLLGRTGAFWRSEWFDHVIRHREDLWRLADYIARNPARAGLRNWPWCGEREGVRG